MSQIELFCYFQRGWPEDWGKITQILEKVAETVAKPKKCQNIYTNV